MAEPITVGVTWVTGSIAGLAIAGFGAFALLVVPGYVGWSWMLRRRRAW